jgi:hypothetical protein
VVNSITNLIATPKQSLQTFRTPEYFVRASVLLLLSQPWRWHLFPSSLMRAPFRSQALFQNHRRQLMEVFQHHHNTQQRAPGDLVRSGPWGCCSLCIIALAH